MKSMGVKNDTDGGISFRVLVLCMLTHCHTLLGNLNRTEPLVMLLVTPLFFLLCQLKMSVVNEAYESYCLAQLLQQAPSILSSS